LKIGYFLLKKSTRAPGASSITNNQFSMLNFQ